MKVGHLKEHTAIVYAISLATFFYSPLHITLDGNQIKVVG